MITTDTVRPRPTAAPGADLRHEVPTHLDVEDRPLYGLTVRQVLGLAAGGAWAYAVWSAGPALPAPLRAALAAACVLVPAAVLAVRPAGRGLGSWALVALRHALGPRIAVWRPAPPAPAGPPGRAAPSTAERPSGVPAPRRPEAPRVRGAAEGWIAWAPVPVWGRSAPVARATAPAPPSSTPLLRASAGTGAGNEEAA